MLMNLKSELSDWVEIENAIDRVAYCLGLLEPQERFPKNMYWSISPVGSIIDQVIWKMVDLGILEMRDDRNDMEIRWNPAYKRDWED
jgi:hypothetical protein